MESLALIVSLLFCAVLLCGPAAILLAINGWFYSAVFVAFVGCWFGIYWLDTSTTNARYLGLLPILCGFYAMYHVTHSLVHFL